MRATWVVVLAGCGRVGFDATVDATSPDAASGPACGTTLVFQETFATTLSATWSQSSSPGYMVTSGSGHVTFVFPSTAPGLTFAQIEQRAPFDARGTCTTFELLAPPNKARSFVRLHSPPGDVDFRWRLGLIEAALNGTATRSVAYDATRPFWQIQESGGVVYFATATASAGPYAPFAAIQPTAQQFDASNAQIELGIATDSALVNGGTARWGGVDTVGG